ncbi:type IV pilin-like G/H family protein [Chlorogloea sp. CCALA 695]|uniref:type IV pilin-like G/H family protein n=1 Tax=Chlorogloea sp. CCALA 695 TaxID=2107693 RepID=UPI000D058902|nr:type IV pilin-like G/H family protein [Chlorogloea sp. CCALA 695]PSB27647.1 general secretion pathway protein GspH [Chlorogloea sp. CCALA 695]
MKAQIAAKYLQFLTKKNANKNSGFTLIELLVVIIIIGILSAIALPSFLNQAAKARASEARTNVGAVNRAQQAFYLENQRFAVDTAAVAANPSANPPTAAVAGGTASQLLGIGVKDTVNYAYTSVSTTPTESVINRGKSLNKDLKGHIGASFSNLGQTPTLLCAAKAPALEATTAMDVPVLTPATGVITCGTNTDPVGQ